MSRVVYTDTPATAAQEALRIAHGVRLVTAAEEGTGVDALPAGVYGFTYSPALPNAPLFAARRFRSYETHKLAAGDVYVVGFVPPGVARHVDAGDAEQTMVIQPEPDEQATALVCIPYARILQHRQYAAPNQHGFTVTLLPAR
jgi:hypothetical protein